MKGIGIERLTSVSAKAAPRASMDRSNRTAAASCPALAGPKINSVEKFTVSQQSLALWCTFPHKRNYVSGATSWTQRAPWEQA